MKSVLRQLQAWRFRERMVRVAWGSARLLAICGSVLAVACLTDWLIDRYSGSEAWRRFFRSTRVFTPSDPLSVGETPFGLRVAMAVAQLGLLGALAYYLLARPWLRTPPVDDFATQAEKAFPAFDHRLVTAIQLNRETADTRGMSPLLITEVTKEAGEIAARHNLLSLVEYKRLLWALAALAPVAIIWGVFFAANSSLAGTLVKRQALLDADIPRNVRLESVTDKVFPTGSEVTIRFKVTGKYREEAVGVLRVVPDGEPEEFYELTFERADEKEPETAYFTAKLPPSSKDFDFLARLGDGRTKVPDRVTFEAPPQLAAKVGDKEPLTAVQVLPRYLGVDSGGDRYFRRNEGWTRGEVVDALPQSTIVVDARFNKPVAGGKAELVPVLREGLRERELPPVQPVEVKSDRLAATWVFPTHPKMIGYRLALVDDRGFRNPTQIRRNIRMWEDRPPFVEFKPESTRNPDPALIDGQGNPKDYEWDMALGPDGLIMVIYSARSEVGVRAVNIRYRVIPKGVAFDSYPEEYRRIQHPREDPDALVYDRLLLSRVVLNEKNDLGPFVPDLGLFQYAFRGVPKPDRHKVYSEFYPFPSRSPETEPGELEAGGRRNFEVAGLLKKVPEAGPDGKVVLKPVKIEIGDTVEVYLEVFDKLQYIAFSPKKRGALALPTVTMLDRQTLLALPKREDGNLDLDRLPNRSAGYTREAKRKIMVSEADAMVATRQRDEARQKLQDKLRDLASDQADVFRPKKKP